MSGGHFICFGRAGDTMKAALENFYPDHSSYDYFEMNDFSSFPPIFISLADSIIFFWKR